MELVPQIIVLKVQAFPNKKKKKKKLGPIWII